MSGERRLSDDEVVLVLRSMKSVWEETLGVDDDELPEDPNESLWDYVERIDPGDSLFDLSFIFAIEQLTGETVTRGLLGAWYDHPQTRGLSQQELEAAGMAQFIDLNETRGLRGLAEWVAARRPPVSIEPYRIGSHASMAAGVYLELEKCIREEVPDAERFGPSSRVNEVIPRRRLRRLSRRFSDVCGIRPQRFFEAIQLPHRDEQFGGTAIVATFLLGLLFFICFAVSGLSDGNAMLAAMIPASLPLMLMWLFADDGVIGWRFKTEPTLGELSRDVATELDVRRAAEFSAA